MSNFCSDNVTGAAPEILAALEEANRGAAMPYGDDEWTRRAEARFREVFECELAVFPVATGTAANVLALTQMTPPYGMIYVHPESHLNSDECGAPEFYTGGAKLVPVPGANGKLDAAGLEAAIAGDWTGVVHHPQPAAVSISQVSEAGTVYQGDELEAIAEVAHGHGLGLHMDGARFANAVAALGCSPAAASWQAGVDLLSFGATKNGALAAEAVLVFDPRRAADLAFRRKRGGHLFSKMRVLSAQLVAYLDGDLWLRHARHANAQARRLADGLAGLAGARLLYPVEANEIFVALPEAVVGGLEADGFRFYRWAGEGGRPSLRLVTAFNTDPGDVDAFLASARRHAGTA